MSRFVKYIIVLSVFFVLTACDSNEVIEPGCELNNDDFATIDNNPLEFDFNYKNSTEEIDYTNLFINGNQDEYIIDDSNIDWDIPATYEVSVSKVDCNASFDFDVTVFPGFPINSRYYVEMGSTVDLSELVLNYDVLEVNNYVLSVDTSNLNNTIQGVYQVDITLSIDGVELTTESVEIEVKDSEAPKIFLRQDFVVIEQGYDIDLEDFIYNVTDNVSRRLKDRVHIADNVFSNLIQGEYNIEYSVVDDANNVGTAILNVTVLESMKPTITLNGADTVFVKLNSEYTEDEDIVSYEDITPEDDQYYMGDVFYQRFGEVNTSEVGIYEIEYRVSDTAEQTNSVYRRVIVYDDLNFLDSQLFGGNGGIEEITRTQTLSDGSVVAIGYTSTSENSSLVNTADVSNYYMYPKTGFVIKFNEINEVEWIHIVASDENSPYPHLSYLSDLMVDDEDNIYVVGMYHGIYDDVTASIGIDESYFSALAVPDLLVTKLTEDGVEVYTTLHGTSALDMMYSADMDIVNGELMIYAIGYIGTEDNDFEDDELENDTYGLGIFSFTAEDGMLDEFQILDNQDVVMNDIIINPNNNQLIIVGAYWDYPLLMQMSTNLFDRNVVIKYFEDVQEGEFLSVIDGLDSGEYVVFGYTDVYDQLWDAQYNEVQSGYVVKFSYNPNGISDEDKFVILKEVVLTGFSETKAVANESWVETGRFDADGNLYVVGTTSNAYDENLNFIPMGNLEEFVASEEHVVYSIEDGFIAKVDLENESYEYVERLGSTEHETMNAIEIIGNRMFLAGKTSANKNTDHLGNINLIVKDDIGHDILVFNKIDITDMISNMIISEEDFTYYGTIDDVNNLVDSLNEYFALETDYTVSVDNDKLVLFDDAVEVYSIDIVVQ